MTAAPSLGQFMTAQPDPEDDVDFTAPDPLTSIAHSLDRMLAIVEHHELEETEAGRLREAHDDLDAKYDALVQLVLEIEEIVKPSTSKLANSVRAALGRWSGATGTAPIEEPAEVPPGDPAADPVVEPGEGPAPDEVPEPIEEPGAVDGPPHKDADVEAWRAYAVAQGVTDDLSRHNRSQIRTLLGITQTAAVA